MNEQLSVKQVRETLEIMRVIAPILNQEELIELMAFNEKVLERYKNERYPGGIKEETEE